MDDDFALILDLPVFTFQLSSDGQIRNILYQNSDAEEVGQAAAQAAQILSERMPAKEDFGIQILGSRFAWYYPDYRSLTLIDIHGLQEEYLRYIMTCLILFAAYLGAVFIISRLICRWIIKPVEEAFEKQKAFIADASHELKTPLAVIMASAEAMERNPDPKWLTNIEMETDRMNRLISSLLELTRSESTKLVLSKVDLSFVAERECLVQEARIFEKGLELKTDISEDLNVLGNEDALAQVISILIDNAISHASSLIEVKAFRKGSQAVVEVANNGKPIPPEMQKKIFERFVREDQSRSRSENRFGLGLAIARALMIQNQGTISVQTENKMTVFRISLHLI